MKRKKGFLIVAFAIMTIIFSPAFSQIKFGVKAGVDLSNPTFSNAFKVENMTSYQVGPMMEAMFPFAAVDFGIDLALMYSDNRMTVSRLTEGTGETDVSNRYLMLPLNAKVKLGLLDDVLKLYATGGPYAGYLISGDKINFPDISQDIKAKNFAAGFNLGFGVELFNLLQVGASYKVQLTDNYATDQPQWDDPLNGKSNTWSITAALLF